jgi:tetratricopeptide (TPR) repeat protein
LKLKVFIICICFFSTFTYAENISIIELQRKAEITLEENDIYNSIAYFREIIELNPTFFDARLGLSKAYFLLGEYEEALIHINKAIFLNQVSIEAQILYGRILTGRGEFQSSTNIFNDILKKQENNISAVLGLAELEVAQGNILNAINLYKTTLKKFPRNRKALISSIILFDSINNNNSDDYVGQVLSLYPEDAYVNYIAAKHYYKTEEYERALFYAERSFDINSDNQDTVFLLSIIYIFQEKYELAFKHIDDSLKLNRENPDFWYLLGEIYIKLSNPDKAIFSYATALSYGKQNELPRIALENALIKYKPINDPLRVKYAKYHFEQGMDLINKNFSTMAKNEFRRGLLLFPHSVEGQKLYARLIKTNGLNNTYFSMLQSISDENPDNLELLDEVEIYDSILSNTVSENWELDQFIIESPRFNIDIFLNKTSSVINIFNEGRHIGLYLIHALHSHENIEGNFFEDPSEFTDAYRIARNSGSDYFMIFDFMDTERSFSLEANIYHSQTGSLLLTLPVFKTGNQKIILSLVKISRILSEVLPKWSKIIDRKFNRILMNIGKVQGTIVGDIFYIIRKEDLSLKNDSIALNFEPTLLLGEVEVTKTDDLVSEGTLKKYNFFDLINPGDSLIKKTELMDFTELEENIKTKQSPVELYKSIISIP